MSASEHNPPLKAQKEQIRNSTMQKPATDTDHAEPSDVNAAGTRGDRRGPRSVSSDHDIEDVSKTPSKSGKGAMIPEDVHPESVDMHNFKTTDNSVDTDGKGKGLK